MRAFFGAVLRFLDATRKLLHFVLLLIIFGFIFGIASSSLPSLPRKAALLIQPEGELVEQLSGDALERAIAEARRLPREQTLLRDLLDAIHVAKADERVQAIALDLEYLTGGGQPTLDELARALVDFRTSGKRVVAYATAMLQDQYYVAAHADEVYVDPFGLVLLDGYDRYRLYYKAALEKIGVDMNVFRVGAYKSAVEPYTRQDMSPEDREESTVYLNSLWQTYRQQVAKARRLDPARISDYVANYAVAVAAAKGDAAQVALDAGLVTGVKSSLEIDEALIELVGEDERSGSFAAVELEDYMRVRRAEKALKRHEGSQVAVLVASGDVLDGDQPPGTIGGLSTSALIRDARLDEDVKAVVLRVDSPGGSVLAAEQIYREVKALRESGKPVVVSMGDVAASGGYYIAAAADEILASPATITGSIGIFAAFPTVNRTLDKLGISVDGVGTTPLSGQLRLDRPVGKEAAQLLQAIIERGYDEFLLRVAEGRKKTRAQVDAVAQGRVWSGEDAVQAGLVDKLGSVDDAIRSAAKRAGLAEGAYEIDYYEPELSWAEELALRIRSLAVRALVHESEAQRALARVVRAADPLQKELERWARIQSRTNLYSYCFCDVR